MEKTGFLALAKLINVGKTHWRKKWRLCGTCPYFSISGRCAASSCTYSSMNGPPFSAVTYSNLIEPEPVEAIQPVKPVDSKYYSKGSEEKPLPPTFVTQAPPKSWSQEGRPQNWFDKFKVSDEERETRRNFLLSQHFELKAREMELLWRKNVEREVKEKVLEAFGIEYDRGEQEQEDVPVGQIAEQITHTTMKEL